MWRMMDGLSLSLFCTYIRHELPGYAPSILIETTVEESQQVVIVSGGDEWTGQVAQSFMGRFGIEDRLVRKETKTAATFF